MKPRLLALVALTSAASLGQLVGHAQDEPAPSTPPAIERTQPVEIGTVHWLRDLEQAIAASKERELPILVLFQEVPGCSGCQEFGASALSHPLVVDTVEEFFVPLCIYNNVEGADRATLELFQEPPWNYQAFRVIDAERKTLVARVDNLRTTNMLCEWLLHTFDALERPVPHHLDLVRDETLAEDHPQWLSLATFSMHCYWEGEHALGGLDGVLRTRAGWIGEREVVEVEFDHRRLPYTDLIAKAAEHKCLERIFTHDQAQARVARRLHPDLVEDLDRAARPVKDSEQFYHLRRTVLGHLPLSPVQCTKLNAAITVATDGTATFEPPLEHFLSRRQLADLARAKAIASKEPAAFEGLYPPTRTDGLWEYRERFEALLAAHEIAAPAAK